MKILYKETKHMSIQNDDANKWTCPCGGIQKYHDGRAFEETHACGKVDTLHVCCPDLAQERSGSQTFSYFMSVRDILSFRLGIQYNVFNLIF